MGWNACTNSSWSCLINQKRWLGNRFTYGRGYAHGT